MSGYAAAARIERAAPRFVGSSAPNDAVVGRWAALADDPSLTTPEADAHDDDPFIERWAAFRDRWTQLTFFLFDAEGWR